MHYLQKSGHVDDDLRISTLDAFCEMDGPMSRYIREVLEWYRGEDAEDLKRSELNQLVDNLTRLNALHEKIWKSYKKVVMVEKSWKFGKNNQDSVMSEELVQNGVMNDKFVKNFVMNAKIDPKVVMDLSIFKIGGWNRFATQLSKISGEIC